jgi:hypothetical protein
LTADLADFLLLLHRCATTHQADALRGRLVALLRPELDAIGEAIARLEGK